jgi:hypothetical protein
MACYYNIPATDRLVMAVNREPLKTPFVKYSDKYE